MGNEELMQEETVEQPKQHVADASVEQVTEQSALQQAIEQTEPIKKSWNVDDIVKDAAEQLKAKESNAKSLLNNELQKVAPKEAVAEVPKIDPMNFWNDAQKALFNSMTPDNQKQILEMFRNPAKAYDKSTQHLKNTLEPLANKYKEVEPLVMEYQSINKAIQPLQPRLKELGVNNSQFLQSLVQDALVAQENPIKFIAEFLRSANIDPQELIPELEAYAKMQNDPLYQQVQPLKDEVTQLREWKTQQEEARLQQQEQIYKQEADQRLREFASMKDEQGKPTHPYFNDVVHVMGKISEQTNNYDLEDLYNQAIWTDPVTRSKMLEIERQTAVSKQLETARIDKSSKVAKVNVKSSPSDSVATPNGRKWDNLDSIIERAVDSLRDS